MSPFAIFLGLLWGLCAAGFAWYTATIARQITYVTLADGRKQARLLPLSFRLLLPLTPNLTAFFGRPIFARTRDKVGRRLTAAGVRDLLAAEEFLALRVLIPAVFGLLWIVMMLSMLSTLSGSWLTRMSHALYALGPVWLCLYPGSWLKRTLAARHAKILKSLPFVLDLLTLSVEAGMDFMTALQRIIERSKIDPLIEELIRVIREIQLGKTRRESLRDMSSRVDLTDLRMVVNALVQADELGVSIGSILRIQADQMRQRRFERAEKLANEAPVKMLFPLMFFIFPAVFLILLGPIIHKLLQQGI